MLREIASRFEIRTAVLATCVLGLTMSSCARVESSSDANGDSSGAGSPSPGDSSAPSGGTFTGNDPFEAFVHVTAVSNGGKQSDVPVVIEIQITRKGAPVSDATVMAGPQGKTTIAMEGEAGDYVVEDTGLAPWYEVDIATTGGASLTNIRLQAPALHTVSIPAVPSGHKPAVVKWAPNHDPAVNDVEVGVLSWQQQQTTYDQHVGDTGELTLPGTAVSSGDTVTVQVRRATSIALAVPNSAAIIDVTSSADTVIR